MQTVFMNSFQAASGITPGSGTFYPAANTDALGFNLGGYFLPTDYMYIQDSDIEIEFMRFLGLTIPPGATIDVATLEFYAANNSIDSAGDTMDYAFEQVDDAPTAANASGLATRYGNRGSILTQALFAATTGTPNVPYTVTGLASRLQAIIDRPGWVSGNDVAIFMDRNAVSIGGRQAHSYYTGQASGWIPSLYVEWS